MSINETVLEMHYHHSLLETFRDVLGIGEGRFNFYKYSPQRECFVGFDQAFIESDLPADRMFDELKERASGRSFDLGDFFFGYFLQFKVVKEMRRQSYATPAQIESRPHYRVTLDTKRKNGGSASQHELLFSLSRNANAMVYYACPMIFDRSELYKLPADLGTLRVVDCMSCPSTYVDNEAHHIYFDDVEGPPIWCSEPVEGKAIAPSDWAELLGEQISTGAFAQRQEELLDELQERLAHARETEQGAFPDLLESSFTLVSFEAVDV